MKWILPGVILLTACSGKVAYDYDKNANFQQKQNFAFVHKERHETSSIDAKLIEQAIQSELTEGGFEEVTGESADLLVNYRFQQERDLNVYGAPAAGTYGPGTGANTMNMNVDPRDRELQPAELVVEVMDPQNQEVLWKASALMDFQNSRNNDTRAKVINDVVDEMFQKFPPQ